MDELRKCTGCKKDKELKEFDKNRKGEYNKWCIICLDRGKKRYEKNKCIHGRKKNICNDCEGVSMCEHGRQKRQCKPCGGVSICEHNRIKSTCKPCGGVSICEHNRIKHTCKGCNDPIKLTIYNWVSSSKQKDKKANRYTGYDYIDADYCKELINFYKHCYYCSVLLQYVKYQDDLSSIERLDNNLEHSKKNCVLACLKCNRKNQPKKKTFKDLTHK